MTDHPIDGRVENLSLMLDLDKPVQAAFIAALKDVGRIAGVNKGDQLFTEGEADADEGLSIAPLAPRRVRFPTPSWPYPSRTSPCGRPRSRR